MHTSPTNQFINRNKTLIFLFASILVVIGMFIYDPTPIEIINNDKERSPFEVIEIAEPNLPTGIEHVLSEGRNGIQDRFEVTFLNFSLIKRVNIITNSIPTEKLVGTSTSQDIVKKYLEDNSLSENFNIRCDISSNNFLQLFRFTMYKDSLISDFRVIEDKINTRKDFDGNIITEVYYDTKYIDDSSEQFYNLYYDFNQNEWVFDCRSLNSLADLIKNRSISSDFTEIKIGPFSNGEEIIIDDISLVGANTFVFEESKNTCARNDYVINVISDLITVSLQNNIENKVRVTDSAFIQSLDENPIKEFKTEVVCRDFIEDVGFATFDFELEL